MAFFKYNAFNADGKKVSGNLEAASLSSAKSTLKNQGLFVSNISESSKKADSFNVSQLKTMQLADIMALEIGGGKVSFKELVAFTRQFATLVDAGMPVIESLDTLIDQAESRGFIQVLQQVRTEVSEGKRLDEALLEHPKYFNNLYVNMVYAAQSTGKLGSVLLELADILEERQALTAELKSALTYPVLMLVVGLALISFLLVSVVPKITEMFADMGQALPEATIFLLNTSNWLQNHGLLLLIGLCLLAFGYKIFIRKNIQAKKIQDRTLLKLPKIGKLFEQIALVRFTGALSSLLSAGVPMLKSLEISKKLMPNAYIGDKIGHMQTQVREGVPLARAMKEAKCFPSLLINMTRVGESSGRLPQMLARLYSANNTELKNSLKGLTTLIQPLLLMLMGGLIAFIMIAVLLPIFELNTLAGG